MISLTEKYCPSTLDAFAGLEIAKKLMRKLIDKPWESAWLFIGDAGTGKTTMAQAVARALKASEVAFSGGGQLHHIKSRMCDLETVERVTRCCSSYKPEKGSYHVIIVDEADQMTAAAQLAFLSKLDGTDRPPETVVFFTANETRRLEKRFISRCRVIPFDGGRNIDDGVAFLHKVWSAETKAPAPDIKALLKLNGGNIRSALNALELELLAPGSIVLQPDTQRTTTAARVGTTVAIQTAREAPRSINSGQDRRTKIETAKSLFAKGTPLRDIAEQLGVPQSTAWRWTHNRLAA